MKEYKVKILDIKNVTHDVKALKIEKPADYKFTPGQATDVAINKPGYVDQKRSFTFTSLNEWDYFEFIIKIYDGHNGVTKEIGKQNVADELIIGEPWGTINYKGEGVFIAGGAGVTPFIAILRELNSKNKIGNNKLIFANKTEADIILKDEFEAMLGKNFINILSHQESQKYYNGFITEEFLKSVVENFNQYFYICGPAPMIELVEKILDKLNVDKSNIVKEIC
ncbi:MULTISPECIES: FAD-binding oxidoreductase [unclassified Melioribacter]|uniref:FAD-binding oxidoreductase n=1 Tax=unclassified Melioribacter TaxID=2627329 RepID=UPI003BC003FE